VKALPTPGCTPLVELPSSNGNQLFAKLEAFQVTRSIKGRTAIGLLSALRHSGRARVGDTFVESSSGNLGAALSELASEFGFRAHIVGDEKMPRALRARILAAGAELSFVPKDTDRARLLDARIALVKSLSSRPGHHWLDQYSNPAGQAIHYVTTGPELFEQMAKTCGALDVFVCPVSTGGTISGAARALERLAPGAVVIGVDVEGSAIFGGAPGPRILNGIGASLRPRNVDLSVIHRRIVVPEREAIASCYRARNCYGLFVGGSSGAALAACARVARVFRNRRIAVLLPDGGEHYADSIYDTQWLAERSIAVADSNQEG
jgi:N-(2-amino-2-carboxyethyl)-L-glutamate synthase